MNPLKKSIISTLVYYDILDRPLTQLELYKYLLGSSRGVSFFDFKQTLAELVQTKKIETGQGLYFLPERSAHQQICHAGLDPASSSILLDSRFRGNDNTAALPQPPIIKIREKRLKLAQLKWKKLKKLARWLVLVPFLRLAAVTGSLTAYNTRPESDFDLLIVAKNGRLWLTRTLITGLCGLLRVRRHGQLTQDRICLNCYLTENGLEIKPEAKPRDFHSAQEYGRLTPLLEIEEGLYQKFLQKNFWLHEYLNFYPWPNEQTAKKIRPSKFLSVMRRLAEWLLKGKIGDWLEKKLGRWQTRRIRQKNETQPSDQVYVSDQCLMFHPQSKSYELMRQFNLKIEQLTGL